MAFNGNVLEVKDADGTVLIYRQADGDLIFTSDLWNNEYYRNLEMHLRDFAALTTNDHRAFIEYWGEGTYRWTNWDLRATFRTDWITSWWNSNNTANNVEGNSSRTATTIINGDPGYADRGMTGPFETTAALYNKAYQNDRYSATSYS